MYHYTDGGLRNVWLANGYEIKKTPYGEGVAFHNLDGLTRSICMALTRKASLLTGAEFRYIRSAGMLLSQPALGKLMGIDGQSVARWEKPARCRAGRTSSCAWLSKKSWSRNREASGVPVCKTRTWQPTELVSSTQR